MARHAQRGTAKGQGLPQSGFIRAKGLADGLGIGESTVWKLAAEGILPQPVRLSPRISVWDIQSVRSAMALRSAVLKK